MEIKELKKAVTAKAFEILGVKPRSYKQKRHQLGPSVYLYWDGYFSPEEVQIRNSDFVEEDFGGAHHRTICTISPSSKDSEIWIAAKLLDIL